MDFFTILQRKPLKFILKHLFGNYFENQIDIDYHSFSNGTILFKDLKLKKSLFNEILHDNQLHLHCANIGSLQITLNWRSLFYTSEKDSTSISIDIKDTTISVRKLDKFSDEYKDSKTYQNEKSKECGWISQNGYPCKRKIAIYKKACHFHIGRLLERSEALEKNLFLQDFESGATSQEELSVLLMKMLDKIISGLRATAYNTVIRFVHDSTYSFVKNTERKTQNHFHLDFNIPKMEYSAQNNPSETSEVGEESVYSLKLYGSQCTLSQLDTNLSYNVMNLQHSKPIISKENSSSSIYAFHSTLFANSSEIPQSLSVQFINKTSSASNGISNFFFLDAKVQMKNIVGFIGPTQLKVINEIFNTNYNPSKQNFHAHKTFTVPVNPISNKPKINIDFSLESLNLLFCYQDLPPTETISKVYKLYFDMVDKGVKEGLTEVKLSPNFLPETLLYTQLNSNIDPSKFLDEIIAETLNFDHLKLGGEGLYGCVKQTTHGIDFSFYLNNLKISEWIKHLDNNCKKESLENLTEYIPVFRLKNENKSETKLVVEMYEKLKTKIFKPSHVRFIYEYKLKKELEEPRAKCIGCFNKNEKKSFIKFDFSEVNIFLDFGLINRLGNLLEYKNLVPHSDEEHLNYKENLDGSVIIDDLINHFSSTKISLDDSKVEYSVNCPLARVFIFCPNYESILENEIHDHYFIHKDIILIDVMKLELSSKLSSQSENREFFFKIGFNDVGFGVATPRNFTNSKTDVGGFKARSLWATKLGKDFKTLDNLLDFNVIPIALIPSCEDMGSNIDIAIRNSKVFIDTALFKNHSGVKKSDEEIFTPNSTKSKSGDWLDVGNQTNDDEEFESIETFDEVEIRKNEGKDNDVIEKEKEKKEDKFNGFLKNYEKIVWLQRTINETPKFINFQLTSLIVSLAKPQLDKLQILINNIFLFQAKQTKNEIMEKELNGEIKKDSKKEAELGNSEDLFTVFKSVPEMFEHKENEVSSDDDVEDFQSASGGSVFGLGSSIFQKTPLGVKFEQEQPYYSTYSYQQPKSPLSAISTGLNRDTSTSLGEKRDDVVIFNRCISTLISFENVTISLFCDSVEGESSSSNTYQLNGDKFNTFLITYSQDLSSTSNLWLDFENVSITEPTVSLTYEVNHNLESFFRDATIGFYLNDSTIHYIPDSTISSHLTNFFSPPTLNYVDEMVTVLNVSVYGFDISLQHKFNKVPYNGILKFDKFKLSCNIIPESDSLDFKVNVSKFDLFVEEISSKNLSTATRIETDKDGNYLKKLGFANLATCNYLDLLIRTKNESCPLEIAVSNQKLYIDTCADSFDTILNLINSFAADELETCETETEATFPQQYVLHELIDVLGDMDEEAFRPRSPEAPFNLVHEDQSDAENSSSELFEEDYFAMPSKKINRNDLTPSQSKFLPTQDEIITVLDQSVRLVEDYLNSNLLNLNDRHIQNNNQSSDILTSVRVCDFNVTWRIYDGFDWERNRDCMKRRELVNRPTFRGESGMPSTIKSNFHRSIEPKVEIRANMIKVEYDSFSADSVTSSRLLVLIKDFDIVDNVETSSWRKFLSFLTPSLGEQPRENGSNMINLELLNVRPDLKLNKEESRLKISILPLSLRIDQDTLSCLINFFTFDPTHGEINIEAIKKDSLQKKTKKDLFFQYILVEEIKLKIDYKPKHVDITSLSNGNFVEFMNFAMLTGASINLTEVQLSGVSGWSKISEALLAQWLPHMKLQVPQVISSISGLHSLVNIGGGLADLILLPVAQYKKDGKIIRGLRSGVESFASSTTMEAIKLTTKFAAGTQVFLEQADQLLSGGKKVESPSHFSKFSEQPSNLQEGVGMAYNSLKKNISTAANTVLAIPTEVYEKNNQGKVQAVIRAVPIAVLKPMIGTAEAVTKTLIGVQNSLDPSNKSLMEEKYK
ncbi:autophagy- protein 2 [Lobulomyces angularis]|nr:autophagy- protein 2 [Lobulomyces angularis]